MTEPKQPQPPGVMSFTPEASTMADRIRRGKAGADGPKDNARARGGLGGPPQPVQPPPMSAPVGPQPGMPPQPPGVSGVGAAYPENQQVSLGAIPPGQPGAAPPGQEQPGRPGLRQETIAGIQALEDAQPRPPVDGAQPPLQVQVPVPPGPSETPAEKGEPEPEERGELSTMFGDLDGEDPLGVRALMTSQDRRDAIEARLPELSFDSWIQHLELQQRVPIIRGKLEPLFRTVSGREDLFVKDLIGREVGGNRYVLDKFAMMNLALGLVDINGTINYPNHLDPKTSQPVQELFEQKLNEVLHLPVQLLADLAVNYMWFDHRARKLLTMDTVKNG